jgi:hypothetical protein
MPTLSENLNSIKDHNVINYDIYNDLKNMRDDLNLHMEEFAAAFAKKTNLDPSKIVMFVDQGLGFDGYIQRIWFEEKKELDIENITPRTIIEKCFNCFLLKGDFDILPTIPGFIRVQQSDTPEVYTIWYDPSITTEDNLILCLDKTARSKQKEKKMISKEEELLLKMEELLKALKEAKPDERSELARRYAVTITECEKVFAFFDTYVVRKKWD